MNEVALIADEDVGYELSADGIQELLSDSSHHIKRPEVYSLQRGLDRGLSRGLGRGLGRGSSRGLGRGLPSGND